MVKLKQQKRWYYFFMGIFFSTLFFLLSIPVQGAETVIVETEVLNVRSGPDTTYDRIGQVILGQQLTVEEERNGWCKIKFGNNELGWVIKEYVSLKPQELVINGSIVNVRSGPGINFSKVTSLLKGTKVIVVGFQEEWYQIQCAAGTGWVAQWLVQTTGTSEFIPEKPISEDIDNSLLDTLPNLDSQGISWTWEKTDSGVGILIQGTEPLGYMENIVADEHTITLEFGGPWQGPLGIQEINYGGINKISTDQGALGTLFQVDLDEELSYETTLSNDGCLLNLNIACEIKREEIEETEGKTVVIDPGHGSNSAKGYDPGAVGSTGLHESEIVLDIGSRVEKLLTQKGIRVIMTSDTETNRTLEDRAVKANEVCADAFVSIHANSSVSSTLNGTTTYYYAPLGTDLGTQREARQYLAESIQNKMLDALGRKNLGVREQNLAVLRYTMVPSVLVETAFISNQSEEKLLADAQFRGKAAQAIAEGIMEFLNR